MSNEDLILQFESDTLTGEFHHADHVRLAFAYLAENSPLQALERFTAALRRFATARGKPQLYHEPSSRALGIIITSSSSSYL